MGDWRTTIASVSNHRNRTQGYVDATEDMKIQMEDEWDLCIWSLQADGKFSTKSALEWVRGHSEKKTWAKAIWNPVLPPKTSIFLWRLF